MSYILSIARAAALLLSSHAAGPVTPDTIAVGDLAHCPDHQHVCTVGAIVAGPGGERIAVLIPVKEH